MTIEVAESSPGEPFPTSLSWLPGGAFALVDALPDAVVVADRDGRVLYANRRLEELLGWVPASLVGQSVEVLVPERLRPAHRRGFASFAAGEPSRVAGRPLRVAALTPSGAEVPIDLIINALPGDGGRRLAVAAIHDAQDQVDLELRTDLAQRLLGALADGGANLGRRLAEVVAQSLEWDVATLWAAEAGGALRPLDFWHRRGLDAAELRTTTETSDFRAGGGLAGRAFSTRRPVWVADLAADHEFAPSETATASGLRSGFAFPLYSGRRVAGVMELFSTVERPPDPGVMTVVELMSQRLGQLMQHAEAERDRSHLQREQQRLLRSQDFLLEAGRVLAEAAGYAETLDRLGAVAVPSLADLCLIDLIGEDGHFERMVARHADPTKQHLADQLRHYPPEAGGQHPSVEVVRTCRPRASVDMSDPFLSATTRSRRHFQLLHELGFTSYMCVPLVAAGRCLGALTLVSAGSGRRFYGADLTLAEELAAHAATVVHKARRYDRERGAAHQLQRSLLPNRLPEVAGVEVAVHYAPGSAVADVGGDWYDVVPLGSDGVGFAIGDVAGHDIGAAGIMGQLRNAMRAFAIQGDGPAAVLHEMRRFCEVLDIERIATLLYSTFVPSSGTFTISSAGHPAPVVVRVDGAVEVPSVEPEPPLGVPGPTGGEAQIYVERGEAVVMFTDGLIERRGSDLGAGLARLVGILQAAPKRDARSLCELIVKKTLSGDHGDDVAFLVFRRL
ncbi:MAG: SpoIIE family protein phosphatase [Acidimicrobiales bacterium]